MAHELTLTPEETEDLLAYLRWTDNKTPTKLARFLECARFGVTITPTMVRYRLTTTDVMELEAMGPEHAQEIFEVRRFGEFSRTELEEVLSE